MIMAERTKSLIEESGVVTFSDTLTSFLYELIRDHLPAGVVENMVVSAVNGPETVVFTNGWLAKYANNLAEMIKNSRQVQLEEALKKAFSDVEEKHLEEMEEAIEKAKDVPKEEIDDAILAKLEQKVEEINSKSEAVVDENEDDFTTIDEAKEMVKELKAKGHIKEEDALRLQEELDSVENGEVDSVDTEVTEELVEKWKNTDEELQKIEEESKPEGE